MNYEELYNSLLNLEKDLKDKQSAALKQYKNAMKNTETGDVKALSKNPDSLLTILSDQKDIAENPKKEMESFDTQKHFISGDFAEQLLASCAEKEIDVKGEYPVYEMFPYKVNIDAENQDVYVDKKRIPCAKPAELAKQIKLGQDKLNKASFNAQREKAPGADLFLTDLYKFMVPMARSRKEYDMQNFAFNLASVTRHRKITTALSFFQLKRYGFMISRRFIWKFCGSVG